MLRRLIFALPLLCVLGTFTTPLVAQQMPTTAQGEFVPIKDLPPEEKMPAAPFLISAYAIIWIIAMFYIWTIWQRVGRLEGEFRALERRAGRKDTGR
jgi:CcmD family protein